MRPMDGPVQLTLATVGRNGTRIVNQLLEHSSGLTVNTITSFASLPERGAITSGDCVVAIVAEEVADAPTLYEEFRQTYSTHPLVMVTTTDEAAFIESLLDDEYGEYVYLPADDIPVGLISVRCKRLVEQTTVAC